MAVGLSQHQLEEWDAQGFLVLKSFFPAERLQQLNDLVDQLWKTRHSKDNPLVIDIFDGMPAGRRIFFNGAPDEARRCPYKLNDLYLEYPEVRQFALDQGLTQVLHDLLEGTPMLCNTINFEWGPGQEDHFDTLYMPPKEP